MNILNNSVSILQTDLTEVLPAELAKLCWQELQVRTVYQLFRYVPYRYIFQGELVATELPQPGERITLEGEISAVKTIPLKQKKSSILKLSVTDGSRTIKATFFNSDWLKKVFIPGSRILLAGVVSYYRGELQLAHPNWLLLPPETKNNIGSNPDKNQIKVSKKAESINNIRISETISSAALVGAINSKGLEISVNDLRRKIIPVYKSTSKLETWEIWGIIKRLLPLVVDLGDPYPPEAVMENNLPDLNWAITQIHYPDTKLNIELAQKRYKFDEILALLLVMENRKQRIQSKISPQLLGGVSSWEKELKKSLPFKLTADQEKAIVEIKNQLAKSSPMNRLLQGEVGTGKTLIALLAILRAIDSGYQCVLLAPTEILAEQHFLTIKKFIQILPVSSKNNNSGIVVDLLTGSLTSSNKKQVLLNILTGNSNIIIATHAVLAEKVNFFKLGLVIIDEQHRFGVIQRDILKNKGFKNLTPHYLVMTATPIPRSIAMTIFGDLDISTLSQLPYGKRDITTTLVPLQQKPEWLTRVFARAREEVAAGSQVYLVCFRIDKLEGGEADLFTATKLFEYVKSGPLKGLRVGLVHGKMASDIKTQTMEQFNAGKLDVLVATTVIEVGMDVPNATMMVIFDADRFGISQLHQLRGRVGRAGKTSICLLVTNSAMETDAYKRLELVANYNDGFKLAQLDLAKRKEGDILGVLQSGTKSTLKFTSLTQDEATIIAAKKCVAIYDFQIYKTLLSNFFPNETIDFLEKY